MVIGLCSFVSFDRLDRKGSGPLRPVQAGAGRLGKVTPISW